jgi:excisionase family DNA binding protein
METLYNPFEAIFQKLDRIESRLDTINRPIERNELPDRCEIEEAIALTGLSRSAIYKATCKNAIPYQKFGKRLIFSRSALSDWLNKNTRHRINGKSIVDNLSESASRKS